MAVDKHILSIQCCILEKTKNIGLHREDKVQPSIREYSKRAFNKAKERGTGTIRIGCVSSTLVFFALFATGCASPSTRSNAPKDNFVSNSYVAPEKDALIVLIPPTETDPLGAKGEGILRQELLRQLTGKGYRVAQLDRRNYEEMWAHELTAAGGLYDSKTGKARPEAYNVAMGSLTARVCAELKCKMVIHPSLVPRPAQLLGRHVEWDGLRRLLPVNYGKGGTTYSFQGGTTAISVELIGASAAGEILFKTLGGASLPHVVNAYDSRFDIRNDLFTSNAEVGEGVEIALTPLFGKSASK